MSERTKPLILAGAGIALMLAALSLYGVLLNNRPAVEPAIDTPKLVRGSVIVNFEGAQPPRARVQQAYAIQPGQSAWDAVKDALGEQRVTTQDFGGDLGLLITGFDGVTASGNRFWEFLVNGKQAETGISGYKVLGGDILEFRLTSF